jgi:antitoxin (DNA-binding transcriptional repressor) of toxin-antitoxin stability system
MRDYDVTMSMVGIAELKSKLSEHLRKVRAGRSLTILDRKTPIARLVPWRPGVADLRMRRPAANAPKLQRVPLPPPLELRGDVVDLLMDERQRGR